MLLPLLQQAGQGETAVKMTRLPYYRFRRNEMRLALSLLAYNLRNLLTKG